MLLENEVEWKDEMEQRMRNVEETLRFGMHQHDGFSSSGSESHVSPPEISDSNKDLRNLESQKAILLNQRSENGGEVSLNLSCSLGSFPGSSIISLVFTEQGSHPDFKPDLISCGLISLEAAEEYFKVYQKSMEPCIFQILAEDECLANIRARSSFLTAAICAVGSSCADLASHQKCYDAFIKEVSNRLFSSHHSFDDVRALCIGAFWLSKVSSTLVGLAVRIATDLNLHRCITKMPHSKKECYERTRLYFLVYICDHHCSLIHGKPPMTREFRSLKSPRAFLQSKLCIPEDVKLVSQVELWSISSRIFDIFGADTEASIASERVAELDSINRSLDMCRSTALGGITIDDGPGDFSQQLFDLYIHCSKLYLFSHTFRGTSQKYAGSSAAFRGTEKFERSGLDSALAIVRAVAWGNEIQMHLEALPTYFGTMIAFAFVFLIKAWGKEPTIRHLDKSEVSSALNRLVEVFHASSTRVQSGHPIRSIAKSLRISMNEYCQPSTGHFNVGYIPAALDDAMLALDNVGSNSLVLDYLGDYNSLLSHPDEFQPGLFNL